VIDQGLQGQGWVHSAVSAIEQHYQIRYQTQLRLSRQQALDCMNQTSVFKYYSTAGGVATEQAYPFGPQKGDKCIFNYSMDGIQLAGDMGYELTPANDEDQLKRALRQKGPVSAWFAVTPDFFSYRDGIYRAPSSCLQSGSRHSLLIVGFGSDSG
jgi:hypothetical protein